MKIFNKNLPAFSVFAAMLTFMPLTALAGAPDSGDTAQITNARMLSMTAPQRTTTVKDGPVVLRQGSVQVIELDQDMGSIVLSDPRPVEMIVENSRRAVLRPNQPGLTNLTVLSDAGTILYKKDIVVTDRGENYVRVTRFCTDANCEDEDIYYCPYGCYGVRSLQDGTSRTQSNSAVSATSGDEYE